MMKRCENRTACVQHIYKGGESVNMQSQGEVKVKIRSRKVMMNKQGLGTYDTCFMGYFPIPSQW